MYKQIEEYVRSLTAEERDALLTKALCDTTINALSDTATLDDIKGYITDEFDDSVARLKERDEEASKPHPDQG